MMIINNVKKKRLGIYVHVPYCVRKCRYCDFLSFECDDSVESYVDAVLSEMRVYHEGSDEYAVDTIFIGGGTPSVIDEKYIIRILNEIRSSFDVTDDAEITIEVNPGTVTEEKLSAYQDAGINRLSIGVQSFDDHILEGLGRIHSASDAVSSFELARKQGFDNISIDLMFAVPGLSMDIWKDTLEKAISLSPEHISFYSLQIEEGTEFGRLFEEGLLKETDVELDRKMYHHAVEYLEEHGYDQYEISNAARDGFHSRHNMKYWSMGEYLGLGLGASSYLRPYGSMDGMPLESAGMSFRSMNTSSMDEYVEKSKDVQNVKNGAIRVAGCSAEVHENTFFDDASEFVFTGLRKKEGISLFDFYVFTGKHFFDVFGDEIKGRISSWDRDGYIRLRRLSDEYGDERDFSLSLTVKGFDISNSIMMEFV